MIAGYKGIGSVKEAFTKALGEGGYVEQTLQWRVIPRRVAAAR